MKKQSGFTLIELMVVMAIIAILATAGLSAYTGYIKKARDTTRMEDLRAINNVVIASMSTSGTYPTIEQLRASILEMNNNQLLLDPMNLGSGVIGKRVCYGYAGGTKYNVPCNYVYMTYNGQLNYRLGAFLESDSNRSLATGQPWLDTSNPPSADGSNDDTDENCASASNPDNIGRLFVIDSCSSGATVDTTGGWAGYML